MSQIKVKPILDSINPFGNRLTTFELEIPKFILAQLNTHRQLCLAGNSILEFDLPAGSNRGKHRRTHTMPINEFVDKWHNGAKERFSKPKHEVDLSTIQDDLIYTTRELADLTGLVSNYNFNSHLRQGKLKGIKHQDKNLWLVKGSDFKEYRLRENFNRQSIVDRLNIMKIRQLNETTGKIETSTVKNCFYSGKKLVYKLVVGDFELRASGDHLILTEDGFKRLRNLKPEIDSVVVRKFGLLESDKTDKYRLVKINGKWRGPFARQELKKYLQNNSLCQHCHLNKATEAHHIIPVHIDIDKTFDPTNLSFICSDCHKLAHKKQGWQVSKYLFGDLQLVTSVENTGIEEEMYDLEIEGEFPNFLANGIVVHNSRNAASSRAIPLAKFRELATYVPDKWMANGRGMSPSEELDSTDSILPDGLWLQSRLQMLEAHRRMEYYRVHKEQANRLLEPFTMVKVLVSATEWDNFLNLRLDDGVQSEIREVAEGIGKYLVSTTPPESDWFDWHVPYHVDFSYASKGLSFADISGARCARVSYLNHDGHTDEVKDLELANRLTKDKHLSPFEHVAVAIPGSHSNFKGWCQYRSFLYDNTIVDKSWKEKLKS